MSVPTFHELCRAELELCGVEPRSTVAVLSQGNSRLNYVDTFMAAAEELGAVAYNVRLNSDMQNLDGDVGTWEVGDTPLARNRPALEALKVADLVVDTIFLLFSKEQLEIQESGAKVLLCIEPVEHLREMFPTRDLRERVEYGESLLSKASQLRFTNEHGTEVIYDLGAYPVITQYGYTDTPGRWDHWPSGFLFTGGSDDGVNGKVVLGPGDIILPFKDYIRSPIELVIRAGRIERIDGDLDADLLREYMASFHDEKAYGIAHIGWGMLETARWSALATDRRGIAMHPRSFYGNVLFSTGPNQELGGTNDTECHLDLPMRNCTLYLDDEPIVVDGDIVVDEMKARGTTAV